MTILQLSGGISCQQNPQYIVWQTENTKKYYCYSTITYKADGIIPILQLGNLRIRNLSNPLLTSKIPIMMNEHTPQLKRRLKYTARMKKPFPFTSTNQQSRAAALRTWTLRPDCLGSHQGSTTS